MTIALFAFSRRSGLRPYAILAATFSLVTFLILQLYHSTPHLSSHDNPTTSNNLHIAIFATSANYHLCQLHLSAALMGYPAPILLNYGDQEDIDEMKQHLAKIQGALSYFDSMPASQQDDLVLMLDGFDIWFQLPHEHIIKRYHDVVHRAHERHLKMFGAALVAKHNIRNTVIFGPDKQCAPAGPDHSSCWAVPESWLEPLSFGPDTDHGGPIHNRPRWLNSGTIMGPAREVRAVFERALEQNRNHHVTDSDQFYFSHVYGVQSYARRVHKLEYDRQQGCDVAADEEFLQPKQQGKNGKDIPSIKDQKTEYYVGLDWSSDIFQTAGYYADYLTWIRHNSTSLYVQQAAQQDGRNRHHHFDLPADLVGKGPLSQDNSIDPVLASWRNLPLATNTVSRTVPAVLHVNGKKGYRHLWWPRIWFYPHIERMLAERVRETMAAKEQEPRMAMSGAWTFSKGDKGFVTYNATCGQYQSALLGRERPPSR